MREDDSEYEMEEGEDCDREEEPTTVSELAEVSMNSVVGLSSPRTMKLRGTIKDEDVVIMIDSGASHNFVSKKLVSQLELNAEETKGYGVIMGTCTTVIGEWVCQKV